MSWCCTDVIWTLGVTCLQGLWYVHINPCLLCNNNERINVVPSQWHVHVSNACTASNVIGNFSHKLVYKKVSNIIRNIWCLTCGRFAGWMNATALYDHCTTPPASQPLFPATFSMLSLMGCRFDSLLLQSFRWVHKPNPELTALSMYFVFRFCDLNRRTTSCCQQSADDATFFFFSKSRAQWWK